MRHTFQLYLLAAALMFCQTISAQVGSATPVAETNSWKEFSPSGGGFRILFPEKPKETIGTINVAAKPLLTHEYTSGTSAEYRVVYFVLPPDLKNSSRALLNSLGEAVINENKGSLVSEHEFTLENHPGRLLEVNTAKGTVIRTIFLAADARLYRLTVTMPPETAPEKSAQTRLASTKFLESFSLVPLVPMARGNSYLVTVEEGEMDLDLKQENLAGGLLRDTDVAGKAISLPAPTYPRNSSGPVASGTVKVKILIDEEGKVIAAQVVSGHPLLRESALEAARQARFTPVLKNGKAAKVRGTLIYNFVFDPNTRIR